MRTALILICIVGAAIAVPPAQRHSSEAAGTCVRCGKAFGRDVPESALSADPDFKQLGMFQCCQTCMDKNMDRRTQGTYTQVALKYKWTSIAHNKSLAFRLNRPKN
ncbi:MAG: hypothetical protein WCP22_09645 [Chlamydiota bacterium]